MAGDRNFRSVLFRVLKVLGIVALVVFVVFGVASWILFNKKNELLLDEIQSFVDKSQSGQLEISAIDFKLFRSFPDVTIELKGIKYYEHRDSVRQAGEAPILAAEHFFVALDLLPLLRDQLRVSRIAISNAQLDLVEYDTGKLNLQLALAPPAAARPVAPPVTTSKEQRAPVPLKKPDSVVVSEPGSRIEVKLDLISLDDVSVSFKPANGNDSTLIVIDKLKARLSRTDSLLKAELSSASELKSVHVGKKAVPPGRLSLDGAIEYDRKNKLLTIVKSDIGYDAFSATISGRYARADNQIALEFDASSNDLELLSIVIKPEVLKQNPDLLNRGDIYIRGHVAGALRTPRIDVQFGMKDLALRLPRNLGTFNDVAFEGSFDSGPAPKFREATLIIDKISGELPGGFVKGKFRVQNFADPYVMYDLDAQLKVDGFDQVFNIAAIKELRGLVAVKANFEGPLKLFATHQSDSSRSSVITLDSLSFIHVKSNRPISRLSGVMETRYNKSTLKNFTINYGRNNLTINATIDNLAYTLFKGSDDAVVVANIKSSQLYTADLIPDTVRVADIQDRISDLSIDIELTTSPPDSADARIPNIDFTILNLSVALDKLPDLKFVSAKGVFRDTERGLKLDLEQFHADMEQGKLDVTGDLLLPARRRFEFNARLQGDKFPMWYVQELITEIKTHNSGKVVKTIDQLHLVTTSLDVTAALATRPLVFTNLVVRDTRFNVLLSDQRSISATKLNMLFSDLSLKRPGLKSVKGTVSMKQLQLPGLGLMDLDLDLDGRDDKLSVNFSRGVPDTRLEEGKITADFSNGGRAYTLKYVVKGAKLENYIQKFSQKQLMKGEVDYSVDLSARGSTMDSLKHSVAGKIEIAGDSIDIYGVDVDKILRKFERSQHFNLTDLGAVLVAGPVGLAITKGTDFVSLAAIKINPGHHTFLQELRTNWQLKDLRLSTEDVAFTTLENRVALNGTIDLGNDTIPGLTIAVIDKNGCALMEQELHGKFNDLKPGELKIARTLFGSVINFVNVVVGKDCKPIYTGSVKAPAEKEKGRKAK
jgi:uncharacterized protein involved in outer membrane biogenesis